MTFTIKHKPVHLLIVVSLSLFAGTSYADWGVTAKAQNDLAQYNIKSKNKRSLWISPQYRGDKFNIGDGISYDLTNSNKHAFEILLDNKNRGFKSSTDDLFKGMNKRKPSLDVGARAMWGPAVVNITRDLNASKGIEANMQFGGITPHLAHNWSGKKTLNILPKAGLRYQSAKVADYYYGINSSEATATRKAYKAKSAITPYIGMDAQANLTKHVTLDGGLTVSKRAKSIRNSPLTNDKKYQCSGNIGLSYWF